jgi:hypothetical protein
LIRMKYLRKEILGMRMKTELSGSFKYNSLLQIINCKGYLKFKNTLALKM